MKYKYSRKQIAKMLRLSITPEWTSLVLLKQSPKASQKPKSNSFREIQLDKGYIAKVDTEDYDRVSEHNWYANVKKNGEVRAICYIKSRDKDTNLSMARFVMNAPTGRLVDHINHDTLDNRKSNLRICSKLQNQANRKMSKDNTSGFKGVVKNGDKWRAQIKVNNKHTHLGSYDTAEAAAIAYDKAAIENFGEFALTNKMMGRFKSEPVMKIELPKNTKYFNSNLRRWMKEVTDYLNRDH